MDKNATTICSMTSVHTRIYLRITAVGARFGIQGFPTILHVKDQVVRRQQGEKTKESLVDFALLGWQSYSIELASPIASSPFSTGAKVIGSLIEAVIFLQEGYDYVREKYSLSHPFLLAVTAIIAVLVGSAWGMVLSFIFPVKTAKSASSADSGAHSHSHGVFFPSLSPPFPLTLFWRRCQLDLVWSLNGTALNVTNRRQSND